MNKQSQESENFGCEQILNTFSSVFSDVRVMQNIIMPMDGFGYCPTAEFDVIVSCNAGVFVFEIKGYTGNSIEISKTEKEIHIWKIHKDNGIIEIQDPLAQTGRKIKYLRESIRGSMVRGFVYFTNEKISLPPNANADVIKTNDLAYLVRSIRHDAKRRNKLISTENVNKIAESILEISQNHTMEEHIKNCIKTGEHRRKTQNTQRTIIISNHKKEESFGLI